MISASEIMKMCQEVDTAESKLMSALTLAVKLGCNIDKNTVVREPKGEVIYHVSSQSILKGLQYEIDNLSRVYYARINGLRKVGVKLGVNPELLNGQMINDLHSYTDIRLLEFEPYEPGGAE